MMVYCIMTIENFNKQLYIETLLMVLQFFQCFQSIDIKTVFNFLLNKSKIAS